MKVVILAGGLPSTIADDNEGLPKPMVEIGERPILWHIMKLYSYYGFNEFVICAGYKSDVIKRYFKDYYIYESDMTIDLETNNVVIHNKKTENWSITVVDTGLATSITQRVCAVQSYIDEDSFILAYGDCLSDINIKTMVRTYQQAEKMALIAAAEPHGRHKAVDFDTMQEKHSVWVNACTMVLSSEIFNNFKKDDTSLEEGLFRRLAADNQIGTYKHDGFWSPVETKRDKYEMEVFWRNGNPPWKIWED